MVPFAYARPSRIADATLAAAAPGTEILAGGTDLIQLMQEHVRAPARLVDINGLDFSAVGVSQGGLRLGALARMSDVAANEFVRRDAPVVAEALLASASPQVRNLATIGGNLLQRTRCGYFRDATSPCNKRVPGSGCPAMDGQNRIHAVLGTSEHCIASYPGDLATALIAVDAMLEINGPSGAPSGVPSGARSIPLADLHREPGHEPHLETTLQPGEIIVAVFIPSKPASRRSRYLKVRDRASFEWSIASAAVALDIADGAVRDARVAVGGVGTKPWRLPAVEDALRDRRLTANLCRDAASRAAEGARSHGRNAYKIDLLPRVVARAIALAGDVA